MVKFAHVRQWKDIYCASFSEKGGATIAYEPLGNSTYRVAVSKCHYNDNFCKRTGRIKAAGRLKSKSAVIFNNVQDRNDLINQAIKHFQL